jgi:hypothetical protein
LVVFLQDAVPMDASALVGDVVGQLDLDLITPVGLACVRSRTVK